MSDLANSLAKLYPDGDRVRLFLLTVGLDPDRIDLTGDAILRWERVLDEAWKHQMVQAIVMAASKDYEAREEELVKQMQQYLDLRSWQTETTDSWRLYESPRYYLDRWFPRFHRFLIHLGMLSIPPEQAELNDYLRDLRAHIKNEFREKTYLPLAGKPLPSISPTISQEASKDPFISPIHQVILQIMGKSYGGDSASAPIAVTSRQTRMVRNILQHLDHAEEPLILLGEPGSGKTMTLQQAAMQLAEREVHHVYPYIPIYIRLGEFFIDRRIDVGDVWKYVKHFVPVKIQGQVDELEREGRLVIFFDGMDEMSRQRYGEHTETLSMFADKTPSKTLFSCRITDFSPKFLHKRLVILPFDRAHITEYLKRYIAHFPAIVDHRRWTLNELAKHIAKGELPIEANNPFVLWLLCLYLQERKSWPSSRVEMLRFYNERNYERKNDENPANEHPFPRIESSFHEWGRFAYLITERNQGAAIPVSLLQAGQNPETVQEMILVGKRCSVLAESSEKHNEYLIRFKHHRFQEFFTALYIRENRTQIRWLDKLDAPRWQETMINLILMGGASDVIHIFADSVVDLTKLCQADLEGIWRILEQNLEKELSELRRRINSLSESALESNLQTLKEKYKDLPETNLSKRLQSFNDEYKRKRAAQNIEQTESDNSSESGLGSAQLRNPEIILSDEHETILADRVEIMARIMHQVGTSTPDAREVLISPFREAVSVLAEYGNPITQVKVMQACQNVPEIDFIDALRKPLNSSVNWVRNQALLLLASSQTAERVIGSDIATEIGYDLANGRFSKRLSAYWKAAATSSDRGNWWSLFAGSFCYSFYLLLLLVAAAALYIGMWSLGNAAWLGLPNFSSLGDPISMISFGFIIITATAIAHIVEPSRVWLAILASAITLVMLIPALFALWSGSWAVLGSLLLAIVVAGFLAIYGASMIIAIPLHFGILVMYLVATSRVRRHGHELRTYVIAAWNNGYFRSVGLWGFVGFAGSWLLGWWLGYLSQKQINPLIDSWLDQLAPQSIHPLLLTFLLLALAWVFIGVPLLLIGGIFALAGQLGKKIGWARFIGVILVGITVAVGCYAFIEHFLHGWILAISVSTIVVLLVEWVVFWHNTWNWANLGKLSGYALLFGLVAGTVYLAADLLVRLLTWLGRLLTWLGSWIQSLLHIGGDPASIAVLSISILLLSALWIRWLDREWRKGYRFKVISLVLIVSFGLWGLVLGISRWPQIGALVARLFILIIVLIPLTAFFIVFRSWAAKLGVRFFGVRRISSGSLTSDDWKNGIRVSDANQQERLLLMTDYQSLSLTGNQYLDILKDIRSMIKEEPALSTYWEQRNRLEEALKQERQG
jgi:NACHT domain-containing protein